MTNMIHRFTSRKFIVSLSAVCALLRASHPVEAAVVAVAYVLAEAHVDARVPAVAPIVQAVEAEADTLAAGVAEG